MIEALDTYDWKETFALAGDPEGTENLPNIVVVPPGTLSVAETQFSRGDIDIILWMQEGENDGESWIIGGRLKDGRYFFVEGWCDYTGWDCRSGGTAYLALSAGNIARFAMSDGDRRRLGIVLADEED